MKHRIDRSLLLWSVVTAASVGVSPAAYAQTGQPTLTITADKLLLNDRPGPPNEAAQTFTITGIRTTAATHGTATFANGVVTYIPDAGFQGTAVLFYTVCDNGATNGQPDPRCSETTITINVIANRPPIANSQSLATPEDSPAGVTLTASDPDADAIHFTIVAPPSHGALTGTPPALTYVPAPNFHGVDTFTFAADDGQDQSFPATITFNISEVNDPPAPQADHTTVGAGHPVTVATSFLLSNDVPGPFDELGQTLIVTAANAGADTHGTVSLNAGNVTYTPDQGFVGTAVIAYTVCDNGATSGLPDPRCADSTLSVVLNGPPVANGQSAQTVRSTPLPLVLVATDPESDALTYVIGSAPLHGTLSGTPPAVTYVANAGFAGNDSFTFTAKDAFTTSNAATVSILVKDLPPVVLGPDSFSVVVGDSALIDVLANDVAGTGTMNPATLAISSQPTKGVAAVEAGKVRYTPNAGTTGPDTFGYTACDSASACGTAFVAVTITTFVNHPPVGSNDTYDMAAGATLNVSTPGVLANDSDPDAGDVMQARIVRGVTNGTLLLFGTGGFTYTPHSSGVDTFVYHILDTHGGVSADITVTIFVTGPPGPPTAGNDLYQVQQGRELIVAAPGVLANDTSPNPRLTLTALLQQDAAKGALFLRPDGSFVYTPGPGFAGTDQFSYIARDSEGRVSQVANVGITVTTGGPATPTVGTTSPAAGSIVTEPTHFSATLVPPSAQSITAWTVSYGRPGDANPVQLVTGAGPNVAADFDPTRLRNGTYAIIVRAEASGGGVLVAEIPLVVDGNFKPGRYTTTFRDFEPNDSHIPIELLRTYDNTNKVDSGLGVGWSLELKQFRVDTNGALGSNGWSAITCGSFPFLATCYTSSVPHFVTITWPDGHVERFRFTPNQGSQLLPTITTAGFTAEPGTTSTLEAADGRLVLSGQDFLLGDFFSIEGIFDPAAYLLTDRAGTRYSIDRRGGLLGVQDRNGNELTFDDDGVLSSSGLGVTFTRNADNRIVQIVTGSGTLQYTYSAAGDLTGVQYPNGTVQSFTYDAQHNLLTTGGGGQVVRTLHYDAAGRLTAVTDGNGNTSTISSSIAGRQEVVTDPTGTLTVVNTFDARGNLIQQDRAGGGKTITTRTTYDAFDRELSRTDGLGHTAAQTYDAAGNVLTRTDGNGHTTTYTYNALGQVLTTTDALSRVTTNTYDAKGNLTQSVAPDGGTTTNVYDASGNLLMTTDPAGRVTTRTYDAFGQLATVTAPGGNTTQQTVDVNGWVTSVTDPTGAKTILAYDAVGNLAGITDANGHTRTAAHDVFNRVTLLTDPAGATVHLVYDAAGNLTSVTDRNGQTITYSYDTVSRLLSKTVPGAGVTNFTYDAFGRLTSAANDVARLAFAYDDADHVLTATSTPAVANALPTSAFTYTYDAAGAVTSTQTPGGTTNYSYDASSQFATITDPAGGSFNFGYDPSGRQTSMTRPNGITDSRSYNAAGDLTVLRSTLGAALVNQADYTYNAAALRASFTSLLGTATYTYDGASRLTSATPPASTGLPLEQYAYDPVGNRISSVTSLLGSFSYNTGDRLLGDAKTAYGYDNEGNLVTRADKATGASTTYTWTAEHQLVGIAYPDATTSSFRYDPLGRRVEIAHGSVVARYAYDQQAIAAEYDGTNTLAAHWVHADLVSACPIEMVRGGQRYFYLVEGEHSTTTLTNLSGAAVASYRYQAFGTPLRIGALENPFEYHCIYVYATAGVGFSPSDPYDSGTNQSMNDSPTEPQGPNPFKGGSPAGPGGGSSGGNGGGAGGDSNDPAGAQCVPADSPQIYPKGKAWKKFTGQSKKLLQRPKDQHPKKGAGTEYVGMLPTEEDVQAIADYGYVLRCQIRAAANSLGK